LAGDEFGYIPIDKEGSRLLFQITSDDYETQSIIHATNIKSSGWGRVFGDSNIARSSSTAPSITDAWSGSGGNSYRRIHALME
jgi:DNA replication protein DnaC